LPGRHAEGLRRPGADLREFNGQDDHVHLLAGYPPKVPVPALVNSLKGVPTRRLRSEFTGRVNWTHHARTFLVSGQTADRPGGKVADQDHRPPVQGPGWHDWYDRSRAAFADRAY
jgi:hypothetical protein